MDSENVLKSYLKKYVQLDDKQSKSYEIKDLNISFLKLEEKLERIGIILEENKEESICVVRIKAGMFNGNLATAAMKLSGNKLSVLAWAKEGIINQNTNDKAFDKIKRVISDDSYHPRPLNLKKWIGLFLIIILAIFGLYFSIQTIICVPLTTSYNQSVTKYNELADSYSGKTDQIYIANIEGLPGAITKLNLVGEKPFDVLKSVVTGNTANKIKKDTETVDRLATEVQNDISILDQISNPTASWIVERLKNVDGFEKCEGVTKNNDPNGLLSGPTGYTICIYFSDSNVDKSVLPEEDLISLGNDVGGTIEVYRNSTDAVARTEYLSQYDGTILFSGSYTVVGNMVIRTSCLLSKDQRTSLTDNIIKEFTSVEN